MVKQRTQAMNSSRAMLAEFGVSGAGARGFVELRARLTSDDPSSETLVGALRVVRAQFDTLTPAIAAAGDQDSRRSSRPIRTWRCLARIPSASAF